MDSRAYAMRDRSPSGYEVMETIPSKQTVNQIKPKIRWRFRPKSLWPLLSWFLLILVVFKTVLFPLVEGVYKYISRSRYLEVLNQEYLALNTEFDTLTKNRDYMLTSAYVEERGHQIGMIKADEMQMVIVDELEEGSFAPYIHPRNRKIEIGD